MTACQEPVAALGAMYDACLLLFQAWVAHTSDPLISPDAQSVIAAIASHPNCLPSMAATAAPTLAGIISNGAAARQAKRRGLPAPAAAAGERPMLVEASLDLLGTLVLPGQPAVAAEVGAGGCGPGRDCSVWSLQLDAWGVAVVPSARVSRC